MRLQYANRTIHVIIIFMEAYAESVVILSIVIFEDFLRFILFFISLFPIIAKPRIIR